MSNFICLVPKDLEFNLLAFNTNCEGRRELRAEFRSDQCKTCGKIDEVLVSKRGNLFIEGFKPRFDIMQTVDGLLLFSQKLWVLIQEEGIQGVLPIPLQNSTNYQGVRFAEGFRVSHTSRDMKFIGKCSACGRFAEVKGMPPFEEMKIPKHEKLFFTPWPCNESPIGIDLLLCTSKMTEKILKKAKISGYQSW